MSPRTGRPKLDNPKSDRLHIRITPEEKKEIQEFLKESGYSLLELIRIGISAIKQKK